MDGSIARAGPADEARVFDVPAPISGLPRGLSAGAAAPTPVASVEEPPPAEPPELPHIPEESPGAAADGSRIDVGGSQEAMALAVAVAVPAGVETVSASGASAMEEASLPGLGAVLVGAGDAASTGQDTARDHGRELMENGRAGGADGRVEGLAVEEGGAAAAAVDGAGAGSPAEAVASVNGGEAGTGFLGGEASLPVGAGTVAGADEDRGLGARDTGEPASFNVNGRGGITHGVLEVKDMEKETETGVTEEMSRRSSPMGLEEAGEAGEEPAGVTPSAFVRAVRWSPESSASGGRGGSKLSRAPEARREKGAEVNGTWDTRDMPSTADLRVRFEAVKVRESCACSRFLRGACGI